MEKYGPVIVEALLLLVIFFAAHSLAVPLHRKRSQARLPEGGRVTGPLALLGSVAGPLFVLAISFPLFWFLQLSSPSPPSQT